MNTQGLPQGAHEPPPATPQAPAAGEWPDLSPLSPSRTPFNLADGLRIVLVAAAGLLLKSGVWAASGYARLFGVAAILVSGYPSVLKALHRLGAGRMTLEVSMTIAAGAALAIGDVFTALVVTATVLVTQVLEGFVTVSGRRAIGQPTEPAQAAYSYAPIQRIADRLAAGLLSFALVAAAVTWLVTRDSGAAISVIIVAGVGGVAAGTPLAILGAIGRAARNGVVIKGGIQFEALWNIDTVVLDRKDASTLGQARVRAVYPAANVSVRQLIEAAAIAECQSGHPLGRAIIIHAAEQRIAGPEPDRSSSVPGKGVSALYDGEEILVGSSEFITAGRLSEPPRDDSGSTTVFVMRGGRYLGGIAIANVSRPEAKQAVAEMKSLGLKTYLFAGDARAATVQVARDLGINSFEPCLSPEEQLTRVEVLAKKHRVALIGDGATDSPALAAAAVGVAMGSDTVERESADVVVSGTDWLKFVETVRLARRTHQIIRQNLAGTLMVDAAGIALAVGGVLTPLVAAVIHVTSELLFMLNSARLPPLATSPMVTMDRTDL